MKKLLIIIIKKLLFSKLIYIIGKGEVILKVGSEVELYKAGDRVHFFPYVQPSLIKDKESNGKIRTYMFFRESDVMTKVIE